jgi:cytoskeletal protein CcmA (bactofilin family)
MFSKSRPAPGAVSLRAGGGASGTPYSVIGADVTITGNVAAGADLHIDGRIEGDVACATLVQGTDSQITGAITAAEARIGGTVRGTIVAQALIVEATARITGDVSYATITIVAGGHVDGRFTHAASEPGTAQLKLIATSDG